MQRLLSDFYFILFSSFLESFHYINFSWNFAVLIIFLLSSVSPQSDCLISSGYPFSAYSHELAQQKGPSGSSLGVK